MHRSSLLLIAALFVLAVAVHAIFPDDAGKVDSFRSHVGHVTSAAFDDVNSRVYVASAQGAVAALRSSNGSLVWRTVLPEQETIAALSIDDQSDASSPIVVVSSFLTPYTLKKSLMVRYLRRQTGAVYNEVTVEGEFRDVKVQKSTVRLIAALNAAECTVSVFDAAKSSALLTTLAFSTGCDKARIAVVGSSADAKTVVVHTINALGHSTILKSTNGNAFHIDTISHAAFHREAAFVSRAVMAGIAHHKLIVAPSNTQFDVACPSHAEPERVLAASATLFAVRCNNGAVVVARLSAGALSTVDTFYEAVYKVKACVGSDSLSVIFQNGQSAVSHYVAGQADVIKVALPVSTGVPVENVFAHSSRAVFAVMDDSSLSWFNMQKTNKIESALWSRMEAPAVVARVELFTPHADTFKDAALRKMVAKDTFGLHKVLVGLSERGTLFGMLGVDPLFSVHLPSLAQPTHRSCKSAFRAWLLADGEDKVLFAMSCESAGFSLLGEADVPSGRVSTIRAINDAVFIHASLDSFKHLIAIDSKDGVHTLSSTHVAGRAHGLIVDTAKSAVRSLAVEAGSTTARPSWTVSFGAEQIGDVASSAVRSLSSPEHENVVESAFELAAPEGSDANAAGARVAKYIVPNALVVATTATVSKKGRDVPTVTVYLIDGASGEVVDMTAISQAVGPVKVILSEEVIFCFYINSRTLQQEVLVSRMYYDPADPAIRLRKESRAAVLPFRVHHVSAVHTMHGVTQKDLLIITDNGQLLELPRRSLLTFRMLDQRNSVVPVRLQDFVSYTNRMVRPRLLTSEGTMLESTSVVAVAGLDYYMTRVLPNKGFDLLEETFSKPLLMASLLGLAVTCIVLRTLVQRRKLNKKWQ